MKLILGDYKLDEIRTVTKILEQKPPLDRRLLVQELKISDSKFKKLLRKIKNNWRFSVQVNYHTMGLRKIVFVLKKRPDKIERKYLSLYASTIEGNFIVSYYLPIVYNIENIVLEYKDILRYYIIIEGEYKPKPKFMRFFDRGKLVVNVYDEIDNVFKNSIGKMDLEADSFIKRFNEVDLRIIMELQKDPLRSMRAIAEALGYTVPRVSNHVKFLSKNNIIESFSLKAVPAAHKYIGRLAFATIIIGFVPSKYPLRRLAKSLSQIPTMGTIAYGSILVEKHREQISEYRDRIIYIPILTYERTVDYVHEIVDLIKNHIDVYDVLIAIRKQVYTIPYRREEYSKYKGFWNI